jgi:hypothetical protein
MSKKVPRFKSHILILQKFERYLTHICPIFLKVDYTLNYILKKKPVSKEFEFEIICKLNKRPTWIFFIDEPQSLMGELKHYALIFGITNVRIVICRPSLVDIHNTNENEKPIKERIYYELF